MTVNLWLVSFALRPETKEMCQISMELLLKKTSNIEKSRMDGVQGGCCTSSCSDPNRRLLLSLPTVPEVDPALAGETELEKALMEEALLEE